MAEDANTADVAKVAEDVRLVEEARVAEEVRVPEEASKEAVPAATAATAAAAVACKLEEESAAAYKAEEVATQAEKAAAADKAVADKAVVDTAPGEEAAGEQEAADKAAGEKAVTARRAAEEREAEEKVGAVAAEAEANAHNLAARNSKSLTPELRQKFEQAKNLKQLKLKDEVRRSLCRPHLALLVALTAPVLRAARRLFAAPRAANTLCAAVFVVRRMGDCRSTSPQCNRARRP